MFEIIRPWIVQGVRSVLQLVWAALASWGVLEFINVENAEAWLVTAATAAVMVALQWLERKFPVLGRFFGFPSVPSYEEAD
jgi:hypothetical protein